MTTPPDHDNNDAGHTGKPADSNKPDKSAKPLKPLKAVQPGHAHKRLCSRVNPHDLLVQTVNEVGDSGLRSVLNECFMATEVRQALTTLPSALPQTIVYPIEQLRRAASRTTVLGVVGPHEGEVVRVCTVLLGCQDLLGASAEGAASASDQLRTIVRTALYKLGTWQANLLRQLMSWGNADMQDHDHYVAMRAVMRQCLQASYRSSRPGPTDAQGGQPGMGY